MRLVRLGVYPWLVVGTVCVGAFMGQLDASIAQLLLPTLQTTFAVPLTSIGWVSLAYLLVLAATLPIVGRIADLVGRKFLYVWGFVVFIAGSAGCGFASSFALLIAARAVQALGAALLQANSVAIVSAAAGPLRRGRALGIQGAAQAVGLCAGPAFGGLLIQTVGWRWVFWLNVPAGIAGALLAWFILPRTRHLLRVAPRFDWAGALLVAPALALLMLGIVQLPEGRSAVVLALAGAALLFAFVQQQRRCAHPLLNLSLFRVAAFSVGNATSLIAYALLFGVFVLVPFGLERGMDATALRAGAALTAVPIVMAFAAPLSGALSDRIGSRVLVAGGMLVASLGLAALALTFAGSANFASVTIALALFGAGQGIFAAPNNSAIMGAAPPHALGAAGGLISVVRTLGTSIGVAFASALLSWRLGSGAQPAGAAYRSAVHEALIGLTLLAVIAAAIAWLAGARRVKGDDTTAYERGYERVEALPIPDPAVSPD